jgi:hypothetical protein
MDVVEKALAQAPSGNLGRSQRWSAVYYAGKIENERAVRLLEEVALSKEEHQAEAAASATTEPAHRHLGCGSQTDAQVRLQAASSLAQNAVKGIPGAEAAIIRVLREGEIPVARMAGVELFSKGALSKKHIDLLEGRGISAAFRRASKEETQKLLVLKDVAIRSDRTTAIRSDAGILTP